jgi:type I restriction enzyme M protein
MSEGQKGGEFFTPTSIVKLIVEIIESYHGRLLDPASGSGGMFVQSAAFVEHHRKAVTDISIYGRRPFEGVCRPPLKRSIVPA